MSLNEFYNILTYVSIVSVIIPVVFCVLKRKALNVSLRALFIYLCICFVSDVLSFFFDEREEIQNGIWNTFTILECVIICFIYFVEFGKQKAKFYVSVCLFLFLVLASWQYIILHGFTDTDTAVSSVEAVILIVFSTVYLLKFLFAPEIKNLENYYFFWIVLANLTYFGTALIFFMFSNFIKRAPDHISDFIWGIHDLINIGSNVLFTLAVCKAQKK